VATVLIGGSALLIATGAIALAFGFGGADEGLLWVAIAAAAAAAILLVAAYLVSLRQLRAARRAEAAEASSGGFEVAEPAPAPAASEGEERAPPEQAEGEDKASTEDAETAAGGDESEEEDVADAAPAETPPATDQGDEDEADGDQVIAVRKRFHRPECRYAQSSGAEPISRAEAETQGLTPCGVCRP
jgi:hypothetical protein